ncbi:MAG: SulP family inorganic anion transporter [Clostridia bacterium]|nr:SulP family inorganic anion transporter [Clostridia bacterium]
MKKQRMIPELVLSLQDGYTANKLLKDCIAGIIVGIIALPLSIALAIASGASPAVGLITAIFAGGTAALLGGSKTQISGPTGAFVVIVFGIIAKNGMAGLIMASFMAGIFIIIMGLARFGKLIKYIPLPIITGFTAGIAITIFIGQLNDFLGLGLKNLPAESLHKLAYLFNNIGGISWITVAMGAVALLIIVIVPKFQKILPGPLCAILICTVLNLVLPVKSVTLGDIFGTVNINISFSFGFFDFSLLPSLIVPALTIAFLASVESLLSAVVADSMTSTKHNPNMELIGQGCANIVSSLFGGLPATGAIARTSANIRSGGKTPVAALVHSVVILLLSLFLMPYAKYIPMTVFAAILIVVCYNMLNLKEIKKVLKTTPADIGLMVLTFALTVAFDLVVAILVCTSLSLLYQLFKRYVRKNTAAKEITTEGTKLKGSISYMNYDKLFDTSSGEALVLDMTDVIEIDATFTDFLIQKAEKKQVKIHNPSKKIQKQLAKHREFAYLAPEEK